MLISGWVIRTEMKKFVFVVFLSLLLVGGASAGLRSRIDGIIGGPSQKGVEFSVLVVEADSGSTVYRHNAKKALVPASNMKIITSAAALEYLGADYKYRTRVGLCGDTLVVIGAGDPLLGDKATDAKYSRETGWVFRAIAEALNGEGKRSIKDIVVDSSVFDDERVHLSWPKEELNRSYACEVSGLNFNGNCIEVAAKNAGGRVEIIVEPETDFVKVVNEVAAVGTGKSAVGAYRNQELNKIIIKGRCRKESGPFAVAIERPAAFFGYMLAEHLGRAGVSAEGQLIERAVGADCDLKVLVELRTPIADCLARCNKDSFGLAAEAMVKTMGAKAAGGKGGSWAGGREVIEEYLSGLGLKRDQFNIDDGSGLSRENRLSAYAITKVLRDMYRDRNWELYEGSLAVGGVDGTIARYFKEEKYKGKILGKTGYINKVKAFSGICSGRGGEYVFSILANNTNGKTRGAINDIAKAIVDGE
jgi:D-alanyl-D-alanine carboxypeptidase/D-alanyl-D-alanine-endopeptidase (penicillin-binding protein 4)